jgi:hypothetical protein
VSRVFPLKAFCAFSAYIGPDYKFLQKAVDSYYVALYNPTFGFIQYFKNCFTNTFSALNLSIRVENIK